MAPITIFIGILLVGVIALLGLGVVAWARSGARQAKLEARNYRAALKNAEGALRRIANGNADPTNEASIALYDIEATLYKELEK